MVAWARAAATATIEAAAIGMGKVAVVDPTYANTKATVVELHGDFEDETERAALLVEAVLEHRARIHHRLSVKEKLDEERAKIEDEIRLGLRCEIPIESNLMNMVMGHKGAACAPRRRRARSAPSSWTATPASSAWWARTPRRCARRAPCWSCAAR